MDPYLEAATIWPDFHEHLASEMGAHLNQTLPPEYFARLEMRPEIGIVEEGRGSPLCRDVTSSKPGEEVRRVRDDCHRRSSADSDFQGDTSR